MTPVVIGQPTIRLDTIDSTSSEARRRAEEGAPHGTLVVGREQTAGRGRRGRSWMTIGGEQLYASLVLRPSLPAERAAELTLVAAVALAEALESFGAHPRIKWPNDLELDDRKVAGLLCEMATDDSGRLSYVVIGVGVNLEGDLATLPSDIRVRATTLQAVLGRAPKADLLASTVCRRLEDWLSLHSTEGLPPVLQAWRDRSSTLGQRVRVTLGSSVTEGTALDIDEDGALVIESQGRRLRVQAGEVERLRLADGGG